MTELIKETPIMSPLQSVLHALETTPGPITLMQLSRTLNIEPGALQGMIDFWVRKGKLRVSSGSSCESHGCSACSSGDEVSHCPALLVVPQRYEVVRE